MATAITFADPRIVGALSATKVGTFGGGAGAGNGVFTTAGLVNGPLKDLLSGSYSGANVGAAQAAALAEFNAHIRVSAIATGANPVADVRAVATASAANPSVLTLTISGSNAGGADGDTLDVTVQYAPSISK